MIKFSDETSRQIVIALKVSISVSAVIVVCMLMFGSGSQYTTINIAGLFPAMLLLQFAGILSSIGFLKLTHRTRNKRRIPFL